MKKIIALIGLLVLTVLAFSGNTMTIQDALNNLKNMASISLPSQTGNIEPAIAGVIDAYHAYSPTATLIAETKLTFNNGQQITLDEYLESYVENNLAEFSRFRKEIKTFNGDENFIGQFVLFNMADPMKEMTDRQATDYAQRYVQYQVNDRSLVEFARAPHVNWHYSALEELAAFGERIERLAK